MQNTLFLTSEEVKLFGAVPDAVKEGWTVETVDTLHEETQDELAFRLRMAKVQDKALRTIIESLLKAPDIAEAAKNVDYASLSPAAMGELFFLLGVRTLTAMIRKAMTDIRSDEDVEGVVGLSYIRKCLSEANSLSSRA